MCNGFVKFILREDANAFLKYSPLQGRFASESIDANFIQELSTVVLLEGGKVYARSDAILRIAWHLGGLWRVCAVLGKSVPKKFRDGVYKWVSVRRKSIRVCEFLMPHERVRFVN